jgi:hypothetical protein
VVATNCCKSTAHGSIWEAWRWHRFVARVWNALSPHVRDAVVAFVDAIVSRPVPN